MFNYQFTPLEDDIKKMYQSLGIMEPYQLDMMDIAEKLDIWVCYKKMGSKAVDDDGLFTMFLDIRLSPSDQWQEFGHELCHLLRQAGNQLVLKDSFVRFQETKAENFSYEFCVPSFMLLNLSLPQQRSEAVQFVSETFNVTLDFADKRLAQIERRLMNSQLGVQYAAAVEAEDNFKKEVGCDYIIRSRKGSAFYSHNRGLIGFVKNKLEWEV
jgi:Zn-dependent peptidase ImmA (M78 family)